MASDRSDGHTSARTADATLVASLLGGDEATFMRLVERYQAAMVRLAQVYVRDRAVAEEVAQDAWLAALKALPRFEGRSSFKTWLFHILVNAARTRAQRERRSVPFSALTGADDALADDQPSVVPERFYPDGQPYAGGWITFPQRWDHPPEASPEASVASHETRERLLAAIERLPSSQQSVIRLRDIEGYPAEEVCQLLGLSESNQRVLLHRARSRVRRALEAYFAED